MRRWFTSLSEGDSEALASLAAPDLVYHAPAPEIPPQTDGADAWAERRLQDYPDQSVAIDHVFAADDMVAAYVRYSGTHSGDVEDAQGVPATGLPVEWVGIVHFRIECGQVAEVWSVADDLGRLQRLGVITAAELQSVEPVASPAP